MWGGDKPGMPSLKCWAIMKCLALCRWCLPVEMWLDNTPVILCAQSASLPHAAGRYMEGDLWEYLFLPFRLFLMSLVPALFVLRAKYLGVRIKSAHTPKKKVCALRWMHITPVSVQHVEEAQSECLHEWQTNVHYCYYYVCMSCWDLFVHFSLVFCPKPGLRGELCVLCHVFVSVLGEIGWWWWSSRADAGSSWDLFYSPSCRSSLLSSDYIRSHCTLS